MHETTKLLLFDALKKINIKYIMTATAVVVFFVGIILLYYNMLYNEKRANIVQDREVTAMETAHSLHDYFATSRGAVNITAFMLDTMLQDGRSNKEIQEYLVEQSAAISSSVVENSSGLYGYINGEFLDGAKWVPNENFVPTERPWYTKTMANDGAITLIDPYYDVQTEQVVMAVGKGLADGKGVVAMDMTLDKLQSITEEAVVSGNSDFEIILDSTYMVVAHSDPGEVGKNYRKEQGTLWSALANQLGDIDNGIIELEYQGENYIIYVAKIENDWRCLSIKNASVVFGPLRLLLGLTIGVVFLVVLILAYILEKFYMQYQKTDQLNKQLASISNIYVAMYDVDLEKDRLFVIKSSGVDVTDIVNMEHSKARTVINSVAKKVAKGSMLNDMLRFVNPRTLIRRLKEQDTIAGEFLTSFGPWIRLRYIVAQRDKAGFPTRVLMLSEDIDNERKERDALIDASEQALAASQAKSAFLSNMSHEIRTPINAVLGMNEMILRECNDNDILAYAENINSAGNTLLGIINDILDFSKIEAGKLEIIPVEYDLSSVLNDLVNMISNRADVKGLIISLDFDPNTPKNLYGDEIRVKQIITNILTNAVKYTEKGSVTFSVGFERIAEDPDSIKLYVAVQDTGIGIKPEDMKKLFKEFERIEEKRNRHVEGTGLGMAITQNLLSLMGSSMQVESNYGRGSKFSFYLKQRVINWEPLGNYEQSYQEYLKECRAYRETFKAPDAQLLVVDDNPMNLMVFKSLLKQTKIIIDTATSGAEGLRMTQAKLYDLIFLDHMMPNKDGIETLNELRSQIGNINRFTPAICLTANAISGAREQYISAGFSEYLTKPVDSVRLENMLFTYLPKDKIQVVKQRIPVEASKTKINEILRTLKEQEWIDISVGIQNSGDMEAYLPLLQVFYETLEENCQTIERLYKDGNIKDYTIKVHALKSSARLIGALEFAEEAQKLENAGKGEDVEYINEHHQSFMVQYKSFKEPLAEIFKQQEGKEKPEADRELLEGVFAEIRSAAEEMDGDRLEDIFSEMQEYRIPQDQEELYTKLKEATSQLDYGEILTILDTVK